MTRTTKVQKHSILPTEMNFNAYSTLILQAEFGRPEVMKTNQHIHTHTYTHTHIHTYTHTHIHTEERESTGNELRKSRSEGREVNTTTDW